MSHDQNYGCAPCVSLALRAPFTPMIFEAVTDDVQYPLRFLLGSGFMHPANAA